MRVVGLIVFAMAVVLAACSGGGTTPATAPPTTAPVSTVPPTTPDLPTTSQATTTTTSTIDRVAEIEAILLGVQARWLEAVVSKDEIAWRSVFANESFAEYSRPELDFDRFTETPDNLEVEVTDVLADLPGCLALVHTLTIGQESQSGLSIVLELQQTGEWGISYRGEGWACEGPNPFSP